MTSNDYYFMSVSQLTTDSSNNELSQRKCISLFTFSETRMAEYSDDSDYERKKRKKNKKVKEEPESGNFFISVFLLAV